MDDRGEGEEREGVEHGRAVTGAIRTRLAEGRGGGRGSGRGGEVADVDEAGNREAVADAEEEVDTGGYDDHDREDEEGDNNAGAQIS